MGFDFSLILKSTLAISNLSICLELYPLRVSFNLFNSDKSRLAVKASKASPEIIPKLLFPEMFLDVSSNGII